MTELLEGETPESEPGPVEPVQIASKLGKASAKRRAMEIHAYVGPNGGGKTLCMIRDTIPSLNAGRPVLSTVRLLDPATGLPHPLWRPLTDWKTLLDFEGGDVLLDEVTGVASSRESLSLPGPVALFLQQLRKRDVLLRWSAPSWSRADSIIRECSKAATLCYGFMPETVKGDEDRLWRSRRLFLWRSYDAAQFEEFTANKREKNKPFARELYWRPGKPEQGTYDTLDQVLRLGSMGSTGVCLDCDGARRRPACTCEPKAPRRAAQRASE